MERQAIPQGEKQRIGSAGRCIKREANLCCVEGGGKLMRSVAEKCLGVASYSCIVNNLGNSAQNKRQLPPEKLHRLKNQYADLISKGTFNQNEKRDPEKMRREREELELQKKQEKARLQAEAKEAQEARRKAEAEAASEAKRKLELEREAARKALLEMEKPVEINENSRFFKDLELLNTTRRREQMRITREEEEEEDGLGLYMKHEDEDEEDYLGIYEGSGGG